MPTLDASALTDELEGLGALRATLARRGRQKVERLQQRLTDLRARTLTKARAEEPREAEEHRPADAIPAR